MFGFGRNNLRRSAIREGRYGYEARSAAGDVPTHDLVPSLAIAACFWLAVTCFLLLRKEVVAYRPGKSTRATMSCGWISNFSTGRATIS